MDNFEKRRKKFLDELDEKEKSLSETSSNDSLKNLKSSQQIAKNKFIRTIVITSLIVIAVVLACKHIVGNNYKEMQSGVSEHTAVQVKMALMNYYNKNKTLPVDKNNKIDVEKLKSSEYLKMDVEELCHCEFFLKDDKQTVVPVPLAE